ncbi:MAG: DegT/DnrJ/EryC1/StrS family aminotransferase [Candidatus Nealsonbacteria bacterium]
MYFVHPQISLRNLIRAKLALLKKTDQEKLIKKLSSYLPERQFVFTDMGREAFKIIIEQMNLQDSEMILPAYICDIFYPILTHYRIKPVFVDIDLKTFNVKPEEVASKVSPRTKSILISHTYGLPFDVSRIKKPGLIVIEDCAHSFGAKTGNAGDVAFFSLYKQFPSLRGGMLACPKDWKIDLPKTSFRLREFISFLNCFSFFAFVFKKLGAKGFGEEIAKKMVRKGRPGKINRVSLNLFSEFLEDFEKSLLKRKELAFLLQKELLASGFFVQAGDNNVFCYLSALVPEKLKDRRDEIVKKLKKYNVFCTRIWHTPIILNKEAQKEYQINLGEFPNTIEIAQRIINFPLQSHYTEKDIKKIIKAIRTVLKEI